MPRHPDLEKLKQDADRGIPAACYNLGVWYLRDQEHRDYEAARLAFEGAAESGFAPAQSALGYMYLRGQGVDYDAAKAVELFERAAATGFAEARYRLGELRAVGFGAEEDAEAARRDIEAAAEASHPAAMSQLAYCLSQGIGGEADPEGSTNWYRRAAAAGEPRAECWAAERLETAGDPASALSWYARAREKGYPGAVAACARLAEQLEPTAVEAAVRRARTSADPGEIPGHPHVASAGVPPRVLSWKPRVFLFPGLFSPEERLHLVAFSRPFLRPSMVLHRESGLRVMKEARRSMNSQLINPLRDVVVRNLERRLARHAMLPVENGEPFTILRYGVGDEYRPHCDYYEPASRGHETGLALGGQRVATFLVFLNDVEEGGSTDFPEAGLSVDPSPGLGLLFFNCSPDGQPDPLTLHAGTPVKRGEKWLASRWMRAGPYLPPKA